AGFNVEFCEAERDHVIIKQFPDFIKVILHLNRFTDRIPSHLQEAYFQDHLRLCYEQGGYLGGSDDYNLPITSMLCVASKELQMLWAFRWVPFTTYTCCSFVQYLYSSVQVNIHAQDAVDLQRRLKWMFVKSFMRDRYEIGIEITTPYAALWAQSAPTKTYVTGGFNNYGHLLKWKAEMETVLEIGLEDGSVTREILSKPYGDRIEKLIAIDKLK
ncbi:hypothetical protein Trydic_g2820, partial [Trypoxylus dichotomus]